MLVEFPCPKCGGPALTLHGEVSCPLCGNQPAPPEALERVEKAVASAEPVSPPSSIQVPNVIEFEICSELYEKEEWTEDILAFAVEYLLGFIETYEGWPEAPSVNSGSRLYFSPSSGQAAAIAELCSTHRVSPEEVLTMAASVYVEREKD